MISRKAVIKAEAFRTRTDFTDRYPSRILREFLFYHRLAKLLVEIS